MQIRHCHVVIFERSRQKPMQECGPRRRQATADTDRRRLFRTPLRDEPCSKGLRGIEILCCKTAAYCIEEMLPRYRDHFGRQPANGEFVGKLSDRPTQG